MSAFFNFYADCTADNHRLIQSIPPRQHIQIKTVVTAYYFVQKSFALKVLQHWCLFA